ncbi:acetyltransferase [Salinisphaera sp. T31B1]|uniref:acetyltransferase n=1 Tax=Salinisphaera sp. T31B1 TaxID=727963 RepID=UPI003341F099
MKTLLANLRGGFAVIGMIAVTLIGFIPLLPASLVKLAAPWPWLRDPATRVVLWVARWWARGVNGVILAASQTHVIYDQQVPDNPDGRYVLISNHQCWADVMLLCHVVEPQLPFPRYFIKEPLRWLPVVGLACWALDFPFMKRHSRAEIEKDPSLRTRDMDTVRRSCEVFRDWPVSIVNYAEGTRSTAAKRAAANSPYRALLPPKAGGTAFTINAMHDVLDGVLDMTVAYVNTPEPTFWDLLCGRIERVMIRVRRLDIPGDLLEGDYMGDPEYRARFKRWLEDVWAEKDIEVAALQDPSQSATRFSQIESSG